jgi:UDP-glucose 4-epimerase
VIGAGGFLGASFCAELSASATPPTEFTRERPLAADGGEALAGARTLYFLAGSMSPATAERNARVAEADIDELDRCLACVRALGTRPTVVLASSGGRVYDVSRPPPYDERSPVRARDRYGAVKLELERRLLDAGDVCRPVVLRIGNVYGPRQRFRNEHGVVARWLAAAARGEPIELFGNPESSRDYVFVDDVVQAFVAVHAHPDPPAIVNIGSGSPTSLRSLAELVSATTGGVRIASAPERGFDPEHTWLDVSLARDSLGWSARVPLAEGLARTWAHRGWEDDD